VDKNYLNVTFMCTIHELILPASSELMNFVINVTYCAQENG